MRELLLIGPMTFLSECVVHCQSCKNMTFKAGCSHFYISQLTSWFMIMNVPFLLRTGVTFPFRVCVCVCACQNCYDRDVRSSYQHYQLTEIRESPPISKQTHLKHLSQPSCASHLAVLSYLLCVG